MLSERCVNLPLLPEEGKENTSKDTDLADPKNEHPLDQIGP